MVFLGEFFLLMVATIASIVVLYILGLKFLGRSKRPEEPGFKYVYVGDDGLARELSPKEQANLCKRFLPGDGGAPYIKNHYKSVDGWGGLAGYLERRKLPLKITIFPVNPEIDSIEFDTKDYLMRMSVAAGDTVTKTEDGSPLFSPAPGVSGKDRHRRVKSFVLAQRAEEEKRARLLKSD